MQTQTLPLDGVRAQLETHRQTLERFAALLIDANRRFNLTRLDEPCQIWTRHFLDSAAAIPILDTLFGQAASIIDIGSGAGFPALVIAILRPSWRILSVDATGKKCNFQKEICRQLGLTNVAVLHTRAEQAAHKTGYRQVFDAVLARAVAPLPTLVELTLGFVRIGGIGLYWKGQSAQQELSQSAEAITLMGGTVQRVYEYFLDPQNPQMRSILISVEKRNATPTPLPRKNFGNIKNKPLTAGL